VESSLQEIDGCITDTIDQPVFLRNPPGPTAREQISERLGLACSSEGVAHHCLN
jgi:hypothetical protein